ncbi:MAG: rhomboid family intramembrane serine protease [Polyangiaceae bacterium]
MDRFLARLERRFGKLAIENVTTFIVGGMAIAFLLSMLRPQFTGMLTLDLDQVRHGQIWRLVTFLFIPTFTDPIWAIFSIYWVWLVGSNLEREWGSFKFNVFYLIGMIGTVIAAALTAPQSNFWLNTSLFFAFATLFPDYQILLFFVIPIRIKWLGLLSGAMTIYRFVVGDWAERAAIVAAVSNYLVFFAGHGVRMLRDRNSTVRASARRASMRPDPATTRVATRTCAICGKSEDDGADIRVCSCEKCGGPRTLCLEHARNH